MLGHKRGERSEVGDEWVDVDATTSKESGWIAGGVASWERERWRGAFLGVNLISGRYFRVLTFGNEPLNLEEERQTGKCALFQIAFSPRCNHPSRGRELQRVSVCGCVSNEISLSLSLSIVVSNNEALSLARHELHCYPSDFTQRVTIPASWTEEKGEISLENWKIEFFRIIVRSDILVDIASWKRKEVARKKYTKDSC